MAIDVILQPPADHLRKANEALRAARATLAIAAWETSVSRLYYAVMHVAHALLSTRGLVAHSHKGTQALLALHFVRPGLLPPDLSADFGERQADRELADYGPSEQISPERARRARDAASGMIRRMLALVEQADATTGAAIAATRAELDLLAGG